MVQDSVCYNRRQIILSCIKNLKISVHSVRIHTSYEGSEAEGLVDDVGVDRV